MEARHWKNFLNFENLQTALTHSHYQHLLPPHLLFGKLWLYIFLIITLVSVGHSQNGTSHCFYWFGPLGVGRFSLYSVQWCASDVCQMSPPHVIFFQASYWPTGHMITSQASHWSPPPALRKYSQTPWKYSLSLRKHSLVHRDRSL